MTVRILCVSELGAGAGHLAPLLAISERIRAANPGAEITFVVNNPNFAIATFGDTGFRFLASPSPLGFGATGSTMTGSFYEVLAYLAFHRGDQKASNLAAWDDLLGLLKPDVILADYSPGVCLAARGRIPVALVGNGYTLPPSHIAEYPALLPEMAAPRAQSIMCETLNQILSQRGQPELRALPKIFETQFRGVFAIPETDPYGSLRRDRLLGSYNGRIAPMTRNDDGSIFLYCSLQPEKLAEVVEASAATGRKLEAYIGPFDSPVRHLLQGLGVQVHSRIPNLHDVLERSSVVLSTAGGGLTLASLMAGRPQLCFPTHIESEMNAQSVADLNCGLSLNLENQRHELGKTLRNVIEVQSFTRNAEDVAKRLATYPLPDDPVQLVADATMSLS